MLKKIALTFWPHLLLILLVGILFKQNYTPGTWLTGWDNLHPEFDFKTNIIDRSIWSTWQEYQGLGVRAGNAHAADLLRQVGLYAISYVFQPNLLRYIYHFGALLVGAFGAYALLRYAVIAKKGILGQSAAFIGALYYLLNLGTMQNFTVPYEAFSHFYASLPWLLLAAFSTLKYPTKKTFFLFVLINVLATPSFYIPTVFIVYMIAMVITLTISILHNKNNLKTALCIVLIILSVNAYWLLPFVDFVRNGTSFVAQIKINRMFTQEAFLRNQEFGTLPNVALLKGFLFDTADIVTGQNTYDFLMRPWMDYFAHVPAAIAGYLLFGGIVVGYIWAIVSKKRHAQVMTVLFVITLIMLINENFPITSIYRFFQTYVPLFKQIFRFPFTKFIILAALTYAVGLAWLVDTIFTWVSDQKRHALFISSTVSGLLIGLIILVNFPSFTGHFLYAPMRQQIPKEYNDLFRYFGTQNSTGRIANLPQPSFWGWVAYDWGYRGSGFPWYGIKQPILDRAFDVWNKSNEQYFSDLSSSIYTTEDVQAIEQVFEQYHIAYLWLDERVILSDKPSLLFYTELKEKLKKSTKFQQVFSSGKQTVYTFSLSGSGTAVTAYPDAQSLNYLFADIHNPNRPALIQRTDHTIHLETTVPAGDLYIPPLISSGSATLSTMKRSTNGLSIEPIVPKISHNGLPIEATTKPWFVPIPLQVTDIVQLNSGILTQTDSIALAHRKNTLVIYDKTPTLQTDISNNLFAQPIQNCSEKLASPTTMFGRNGPSGKEITLVGTSSYPCIYAKMANIISDPNQTLNAKNGVIQITLQHKGVNGQKPHLCLTHTGETTCFYASVDGDNVTTNQDDWIDHTYTVPIQDYPLRDIWVKLELIAEDPHAVEQVSYRNIHVSLFLEPKATQSFSYDQENRPLILPISAGSLQIDIPNSPTLETQLNPTYMSKKAINCYQLGKGTFAREIRTDPAVGPYVQYSATDASSCDNFSFTSNVLENGAITIITTKNESGRPIKACLRIDPPGYCLFEDILYEANNTWKTVSYISSGVHIQRPFEYFIELDNYAVGKEHRVNDIHNIVISPLPYDWLTHIGVKSLAAQTNVYTDPQNISEKQPLINRLNPTLYSIKIEPNGDSSTIVLHQAYDKGWQAYRIENSSASWRIRIQNMLAQWLPFIFGKRLERHVLVNNWANGWELNPTNPTNTTNPTNETIIIFFFPQLLEFVGFALLPLPFLALLWPRRKKGQG